jgi:hypothetical protein
LSCDHVDVRIAFHKLGIAQANKTGEKKRDVSWTRWMPEVSVCDHKKEQGLVALTFRMCATLAK